MLSQFENYILDSDSDPFELRDDNDMDTSEEEDYVPCSDSGRNVHYLRDVP